MNTQAKTTNKVNDGNQFPLVQITYLGKVGDGVLCEQYGIHSSAPVGTKCLMIIVNGDASNRYIIPLSAETRTKNLKEGEFECGNFKIGSIINFDELGNISITSLNTVNVNAPTALNINSPLSTFNGNVAITGILSIGGAGGGTSELNGTINNNGTIQGTGTISSNGKILDTHIHSGVTTGSGNTGQPV